MPTEHSTWCRLSECAENLTVGVEAGKVRTVEADGASCGLCTASAGFGSDARRVTFPRRRIRTPGKADRWEDVPWSEALAEIGGALKKLRRQSGPAALAMYAGPAQALDSRGMVRTLAWPLATGSVGLYTNLPSWGGPWLRAVELVLGHALPLQGDVGRAHYVLLLGANQEAQGWGPLQAGRRWGADLAFSRKTKGTKVVAADPRRTPAAAGADIHLPIRPGTELFLVLGMIDAILKNDWRDVQYTDDWCAGLPALREALAAWPVERCAQVCGVPAADISGVALKFSRAAMAVAHRSPQALASEHGTLTAWAILVLHALTANLLRPGGLFDNQGLLDAPAIAHTLRSEGAPHTRVGRYPLLLLQSPGTVLAESSLLPGDDRVRALVIVQGDPVRDEPASGRVREALDGLDLVVQIDVGTNQTSPHAHWILPCTHAFERGDIHLADTVILPSRHARKTTAVVAGPAEARDTADILTQLFRKVGPALRGGAFGPHLRVLGGRLIVADVDAWADGAMRGLHFPGAAAAHATPEGWDGGEADRATWRIATASGKIELLPAAIATALGALREPTAPPGFDRWLLTSAARDSAVRAFDRPAGVDPGVSLSPDAGFVDGDRVSVITPWGRVQATVHVDAGLRADTVDLPAGYAVDVGQLLPGDRLDPLAGTGAWNGLPCRVERA